MKLPIGYKELEYIESVGGQYVDTGFIPTNNTVVECDFQLTNTDTANRCIFGVVGQFSFRYYGSGPFFRSNGGNNMDFPTSIDASAKHRVRKTATLCQLDEYSVTNTSGTVSKTMLIFAQKSQSNVAQYFSMVKIYAFSIFESSKKVADYIPCKNPDSKIGFYDLVTETFILNSGSGSFTAGPEVKYPPAKVQNLLAATDKTTIVLSWEAAENAESYNVYRDNELLHNTSDLVYRDENLSYGSYTYAVETVNQYGVSAKEFISVTLTEPVSIPDFAKPTVVYLLDKKYDAYDAIDRFKSLLWTIRFTKAGEFELYVPADLDIVKRFHEGDYAQIEDSDRLMIVEDINLQTDAEDGDYLIISGRSLESILERRIIWGMTVITGNFQNGIKTLLERNVISPAIESRKIPNFTFKESTDPRITSLTVEAQYFGENLYEEIEKLCEEKQVGFRVLPKDSGGFEFSLYVGEDRSYNQIKNPWVVFAPNYENLQSSNYLYSKKNLKNATLVGGQGENWSRDTVEVVSDSSSGLDRRETFTDASGVTNDTSGIENDDTLTEEEKQEAIAALTEEYNEQLKQKGQEELAKTSVTETFDGEIDTSLQYVYRKDFDLGDVVQIVNAYGMEASTRVSEIVISHDTTGKTIVPTFTVRTDEKGDEV